MTTTVNETSEAAANGVAERRFDSDVVNRLQRHDEIEIRPEIVRALGLSEGEFQEILRLLGRTPSLVELSIIAVMWSEHCCYKSSRAVLRGLPTEGPRILQGPGENAGAVDLGEGLAAVFKVESHNHPSFVMPYHGAATGVGGILRDIFTLGARPVALLDALRFGPTADEVCRSTFHGVIEGIAGYGNSIGVPTVGGEVFFDPSFARNPIINVMAVGVAEADELVFGRADGPGNPVFILGARTGRDGIHGATFASDTMAGEAGESRPQVQIGDPFAGKELMEAVLELARCDFLVGIQDMGAAGLTCSSIEMSSRSGTGMVLDLEKVPVRESGMTPQEIMLSESQERMLAIVERGTEDRLRELFAGRDLVCEQVGEVRDSGTLEVRWHGRLVADLPIAPLADGAPLADRPASPPDGWRADAEPEPLPEPDQSLGETLLALLGSENLRSREHVYSQYDHTVRADTLLKPGAGDAAVLRLRGRDDGLAVTLDGNSRYVALHPREGAALTVAEAARNLACVGARPLAVTDGLNFASPERPQIFWQFKEAVAGLADGCKALETPVVSGNVSFYNETGDLRVAPSPTVGMVGHLRRAEAARGMGWRRAGDVVALLGENLGRISGSEYQTWLAGRASGAGPGLDLEAEAALVELLVETAERGLLHSAHDVSQGGLAVALAESCLNATDGLGVAVDHLPGRDGDLRLDALLFGEEGARAVVSYDPKVGESLAALAAELAVPLAPIGRVEPGVFRLLDQIDLTVAELHRAWRPGSGALSDFDWPDDGERSAE
ncbi:MAG: phosphoribosylformylglycinamidine synthase subunit PurL [Acidobacteriota bacterium]